MINKFSIDTEHYQNQCHNPSRHTERKQTEGQLDANSRFASITTIIMDWICFEKSRLNITIKCNQQRDNNYLKKVHPHHLLSLLLPPGLKQHMWQLHPSWCTPIQTLSHTQSSAIYLHHIRIFLLILSVIIMGEF